MMTFTARLSRAGKNKLRINIPKDVKELMDLKEGEYVIVTIQKIENETGNKE